MRRLGQLGQVVVLEDVMKSCSEFGTLGTCKCVGTVVLPLARVVTVGTAVSLVIAGMSRSKNWDIWDTYLCWDRTGVVCMVCDSCDTYLAGSLIVHCSSDAGSGDPSSSVA